MRRLAELMYMVYLIYRDTENENQTQEYYEKEKTFRKSLSSSQKDFFAEYEEQLWDVQEEREIKIFEFFLSLLLSEDF